MFIKIFNSKHRSFGCKMLEMKMAKVGFRENIIQFRLAVFR